MKKQQTCAVALSLICLAGVAGLQAQGPQQDKQFLMTASQGDYTEITFSKLAVEKSSNPQIKQFAQTIISDHAKQESSMQPIEQQMGITPASSLEPRMQKQYDLLKTLNGPNFDKQYISIMDTNHHSALSAFKAEANSTSNAQLKPKVVEGEKAITMHMQMADKLAKQMGVAAPAA